MAVVQCMLPRADAVQGRHCLVHALCEWTGIGAWEILVDTDVDDAWDGDGVVARMSTRRARAFVWITLDGDAYGIFIPAIVSRMDTYVKPSDVLFFCTRTHLDRMVPIRYVADRTLLDDMRATISTYPYLTESNLPGKPNVAYVNARWSMPKPLLSAYTSLLPLFAGTEHCFDVLCTQGLKGFWGLGMSPNEFKELSEMTKAPSFAHLSCKPHLPDMPWGCRPWGAFQN